MHSSPKPTFTPEPWIVRRLTSEGALIPSEDKADTPQPATPAVNWEAEIARARAEGYAAGRSEAEAQAAEREAGLHQKLDETFRQEVSRVEGEVRPAVLALDEVARELVVRSSAWVQTLEDNVLALSTAIARHLLQDELTIAPEKIRSVVSGALLQVGSVDGPLRVRLHPEDFRIVQDCAKEEWNSLRESPIEWLPDSSLLRGGCMIEMPQRLVVGDIATALEDLYRELRNA